MSRRKRALTAIETLYKEYGAPLVKEVRGALGAGADDAVVRKAVEQRLHRPSRVRLTQSQICQLRRCRQSGAAQPTVPTN